MPRYKVLDYGGSVEKIFQAAKEDASRIIRKDVVMCPTQECKKERRCDACHEDGLRKRNGSCLECGGIKNVALRGTEWENNLPRPVWVYACREHDVELMDLYKNRKGYEEDKDMSLN